MYQHKEIFDLSNYPKDSKYFWNDNKKVLGKMNNEYGAIPIDEYTGLRSKMYSIRNINKKRKSIHKGHNSYISGDEYYDTLFNRKILRHEMTGIKSTKRYILSDGIKTLPYGHKDIPKNNQIVKWEVIYILYH